ncbi:MAG TPA: hypothetical protein PK186_12105 [candidate division Zixibacteria bacterium]|nr:hypothetical protein [candidate division Zixibacteria bacterium]MDD4918375.1 hypothetical protein [candidate division Zixibacteria bacterium]MDM7973289.1 hypothetical protein [candidate division Zixibacteria bacterium]HPM38290.1 hypothetical protein [candidate division Zixibacteria bacterium]
MKHSHLLRLAGFTLLVAVLIGPAAADWVPADGHKMHYPQLPDEAGWDVNATQPLVLADDWQCSETGWVKDIHFWGSWKHGIEGQIVSFVLSIHADIPASQSPTGYSMPGETLWEREVTQWDAQPLDPPSMEGWYDPLTGEVLYNDHQAYFQYNVFLPEADWFWQEAGTIYWLNVSAIVADPTGTTWGWKSTQDHWNDDAVWATWGNLNWIDMWEPAMPKMNQFWITVDPAGQLVTGGGVGAYGQGWYYYPQTNWYNIWFYDDPFDSTRKKDIHIEFTVGKYMPAMPSLVTVAVNWSTPAWSATGETTPPLPGVDEGQFIQRQIVISQPDLQGHYIFDLVVPDYNPEWVSVDVQGFNFQMLEMEPNFIIHTCKGSLDLSFVITGGAASADTCDYYKPRQLDYAPEGMPDFDMKQAGWTDQLGRWSHDGPAALANCLWWFDSKFEPNPVDPRPFGMVPPNDGYPLVTAYLPTDDHDPTNVQPFITDLAANYVQTNVGGTGTQPGYLQTGFKNYLAVRGLAGQYRDTAVLAPTFEYIQRQVLDCQDVILLLSFWEDRGAAAASYIGSHYVTVAGVCTDLAQRQMCISDPWLDALEGEPPAGSAHIGTVHNDADNISGPHSQIQHDPYQCMSATPPGFTGPVEVVNYPADAMTLNNFYGMNLNIDPTPYGGGQVYTVITEALVICPHTVQPIDTCEYYKLPYEDYAPYGMPDFDQKQDNWRYPPSGAWSHCGPVALANCFWWFDSKFEPSPVDPRPFAPSPISPPWNDNYPLVGIYPVAGAWDDHDTNNVKPFVDSLALYAQTNVGSSGTSVLNLATGAQNWLASVGLGTRYTMVVMPLDPAVPYEFIRDQVLESQDVILLIGFWQEMQTGYCERIGGHYVTVAGTCPDPLDSAFCISDPYFDNNEGEPPAGSAHSAGAHNDAANVSGPHGTIHHDRYDVMPAACQQFVGAPLFTMELAGYPTATADIAPFYGQNPFDPSLPPVPPQPGLPVHAILEWAIIICPQPPSGADTVKCEPQGGTNPNHPNSYWYDVKPGNPTGLFDFHVKVLDTIPRYYLNWLEPAGWLHQLHKVGADWWVSWWDPTGGNPITATFRFGFDNWNPSAWNDWVTTTSASNNPAAGVSDNSGNHVGDPDGYGYRVHVPYQCCALRGDVTHDGSLAVSDLTYLTAYLFRGGPAPLCPPEADLVVDGAIKVSDLTFLVSYLFRGGPAPTPCP